jgi:hypothetical protein
MNKDVKITTEQLSHAVHGNMEKLLDEVTGVVNTAPDGSVIVPDASRWASQICGRTAQVCD